MRIIIDLEEDGEVTPAEVVKRVEEALERQRDNEGLSGDDDEGYINSISVMPVPAFETSAGHDSEKDRITWSIVMPGGGDTVAWLDDSLNEEEQGVVARQLCGEGE